MEPLLTHLHLGDPFTFQVRVDGGELATDGPVLDDLVDGCPQNLHALNACVLKHLLYCKLALVTPCRAASAIFEYFQEDVRQ